MKKTILPVAGILMFMFSYCSFAQNVSFSKVDSLAIKKTVHDFEISFNNHDAKAFAGLFLPDGEFTNVVGMFVKGQTAIEEFHRPMFEGKPGYYSFKNSTLEYDPPRISVIKPDVASVDFSWSMDKCLLPDGSELDNRRGLVTLLMIKDKDEWGIAIMHNAELPPAASK